MTEVSYAEKSIARRMVDALVIGIDDTVANAQILMVPILLGSLHAALPSFVHLFDG